MITTAPTNTLTSSLKTSNTVLFEHPLKTTVKTLMKLEHLFQQFVEHQSRCDVLAATETLLTLMRLLERPDLKAQFTKQLHQQQLHLQSFQDHPNIDTTALAHILQQLQAQMLFLQNSQSLLDDTLCQHPMLKTLKTEWLHGSSLARHSDHLFYAWRMQPASECMTLLQAWYTTLQPIEHMVAWLMKLIRQSKPFQTIQCGQTAFSKALNPSFDLALVRIRLPKTDAVFPEISAGRHHISIHFKAPDVQTDNVTLHPYSIETFALACCGH